jgi:hypothetical protein
MTNGVFMGSAAKNLVRRFQPLDSARALIFRYSPSDGLSIPLSTQVIPKRIVCFNQLNLPASAPTLQCCLTRNRIRDIAELLKIDELLECVTLSEPLD